MGCLLQKSKSQTPESVMCVDIPKMCDGQCIQIRMWLANHPLTKYSFAFLSSVTKSPPSDWQVFFAPYQASVVLLTFKHVSSIVGVQPLSHMLQAPAKQYQVLLQLLAIVSPYRKRRQLLEFKIIKKVYYFGAPN